MRNSHAISVLTATFVVSDAARAVNAVIGAYIQRDLRASDFAIGLASGAFYIAFISTQLPLGLILDRHGPRATQLALLPLSAVGALLCAMAPSVFLFGVGRLLLGVGLSLALMATFKGVKLWVAPEKVARANGFALGVGGLGGVLATWPAGAFAASYGWRAVYFILAVAIAACAVAVSYAVPTVDRLRLGVSRTPDRFSTAWRSPILWTIGIPAAIAVGVASAAQSLWTGLWLSEGVRVSSTTLNAILFAKSIAVIAGSIIIGRLADVLRLARIDVLLLTIALISIYIIIQVAIFWFYPSSMILWSLFAFFGTSGMLVFSIISEKTSEADTAAVSGIYNMMTFICALIVQVGAGWLADIAPFMIGKSDRFTDYRFAFSIFVAVQALACVFYAVTRRLVAGRLRCLQSAARDHAPS